MKKWMSVLCAVGLISLVFAGCGSTADNTTASGDAEQAASGGAVTLAAFDGQQLCGSCGHAFVKTDEHVCDTEHASCGKCGLHEGSELCCKLGEETAGKTYCGSCGQIAGGELCCLATAEVCEKCGFHQGAALCCKLVTASATMEPPATSSEEPTESSTETTAEDKAEPSGEERQD
jgi:hypothetical protein